MHHARGSRVPQGTQALQRLCCSGSRADLAHRVSSGGCVAAAQRSRLCRLQVRAGGHWAGCNRGQSHGMINERLALLPSIVRYPHTTRGERRMPYCNRLHLEMRCRKYAACIRYAARVCAFCKTVCSRLQRCTAIASMPVAHTVCMLTCPT